MIDNKTVKFSDLKVGMCFMFEHPEMIQVAGIQVVGPNDVVVKTQVKRIRHMFIPFLMDRYNVLNVTREITNPLRTRPASHTGW